MKIVLLLRDSASGLSDGRAEQRVAMYACCCLSRGMGSAITALEVRRIICALK